jgi:hypothetical protein
MICAIYLTGDATRNMSNLWELQESEYLISFSNRWFYDRKLEMYPPAQISGIGRRLHYLPNAIYSQSAQRNKAAKDLNEKTTASQI